MARNAVSSAPTGPCAATTPSATSLSSSTASTAASIWQTYSNASPKLPFAPLREPTPLSKSRTKGGNQVHYCYIIPLLSWQ